VAAVADVRETEAREAEDTVDVRVQHRRLVFLGRLPEGVAAQREARVVVEDVEPVERFHRPLDEGARALLVPRVER
jgi:hypothetical protein